MNNVSPNEVKIACEITLKTLHRNKEIDDSIIAREYRQRWLYKIFRRNWSASRIANKKRPGLNHTYLLRVSAVETLLDESIALKNEGTMPVSSYQLTLIGL